MKTLFTVLGVVGTLIAVVVGSYISAHNYGNSAEKNIEAIWLNNQNVLAQYGQKVQEAAQIPGMMRDDVKDVVGAALSGRYGADGSKAVFQWIQEQNPSVDAGLYLKVQQIIEAGRDEFKVSQTRLIDAKRAYETNLGFLWKGFWLRVAGYPKVDLDKFNVVTTDYATKAFELGKEEGPIKLR